MNRKELIQAYGGVHEYLHTGLDNGQNIISTEFDAAEVRDLHKPLQMMMSEQTARDRDMYPVRIIPRHVMDRAFREGWFNDRDQWRRWANGEEGRSFGIERNGKVPTL